MTSETFLQILDLIGTFVFAISGAQAAVDRRLDIFGILVLSFVAGNFGGIVRDLLIGAVPPSALSTTRYLLVSILAGLITFFWYAGVDRLRSPVLMFDAAGLSLFAVSGAQKALDFGLNPMMAALLGMLTGVGGGMTRDVLLAEIPQILRSDLYAVAALAGAAVVVIGNMVDVHYGVSAFIGAALCFGLRFMAIRHGWPCRPLIFPRGRGLKKGRMISAGAHNERSNLAGRIIVMGRNSTNDIRPDCCQSMPFLAVDQPL